jgi:mono/diheme cytochrome c family protein
MHVMGKNARRRRAAQAAAAAPQPSGGPSAKTIAFAAGGALAVALIIALLSAPGPSSASLTASANPDHGKALYGQYCASCHGSSGQGEFNWMNRERGAPALDSSGHAWHHEDAQLVSMILDKPVPDSRMPAWRGVLSRDDAIDLVAYIKSLWTPFIRANCQGAKHMACMSHG